MSLVPSDWPALPRNLTAQGIGLRAVTDADAAFLRKLYGAGRAEEMARVAWPAEAVARFLDDQFRFQHHHFATHFAHADQAIVTADGASIGRLMLDRSARPWRLIEVALMPSMQGRGWGGALLRWLQQAARTDKASGIDLHVAFDNPRAEALYRRLGFGDAPHDSATHRRLLWTIS